MPVSAKAILVTVGASYPSQVEVFGQVRWKVRQPGGKRVNLFQALSAGAARAVSPGTKVRFRVPLPKTVLRRLGRIDPSQRLTARLKAFTHDLAGREVVREVRVRLPGRG